MATSHERTSIPAKPPPYLRAAFDRGPEVLEPDAWARFRAEVGLTPQPQEERKRLAAETKKRKREEEPATDLPQNIKRYARIKNPKKKAAAGEALREQMRQVVETLPPQVRPPPGSRSEADEYRAAIEEAATELGVVDREELMTPVRSLHDLATGQ
jgi:hypothetical protein